MSAGDYAAVQDYLFALKAGGVKFGLDRMRALAAEIGNPERAVPMIHIAGTNGKGSTAAMIESIFRRAGWRTGMYTSPHLIHLGERVQVNRRNLARDDIIAYVEELRPAAERIARRDPDDRPSFFEFMTAMAFLQFARARCDIAVVEVGLGGRLDATNVVLPEVAAITSIGLDHCDLLGDTIEQIAAEKAGIIKPGRPVVIGRLPPAAEARIRQIADSRGSPVVSVAENFPAGPPRTGLPGDYQRWNAATATLVARRMPARWKLTEGTITAGLEDVSWPGRWQRIAAGDRTVILDTSHNPEGATVLDQLFLELRGETGNRPVVVAGLLGRARAEAILQVVRRHAAEIILVRPDQERASSFEEMESFLPAGAGARRSSVAELFPSPGECRAGRPGDTIVVTGSIYLAGEVLGRLSPPAGSDFSMQDF